MCSFGIDGNKLILYVQSNSQVGRIVENSDAVREVVGNPELLRQIIYCIGGEKISVAKEVSIVNLFQFFPPLVEGFLVLYTVSVVAKMVA